MKENFFCSNCKSLVTTKTTRVRLRFRVMIGVMSLGIIPVVEGIRQLAGRNTLYWGRLQSCSKCSHILTFDK